MQMVIYEKANKAVKYRASGTYAFLQRSNINFDVIYCPVIDGITFRYLISLAVKEKLDMCLINIENTYFYISH